MSDSLRDYIQALQHEGSDELWEINDPVSLDYEITAYALELETQPYPPALLFKSVQDYPYSVICNLFASRRRLAKILGLPEKEMISGWPEVASRRIKPERTENAPVKEVILTGDDIDLNKLPIPTHFDSDGGRYITSGVIIANDPDTGVGNLNFSRLQVKEKDVLGASLHSRGDLWNFQRRKEARGEPLEIAIAVGVHPAIDIAAATQLPITEDEMELAGGILKRPVAVVPAETVDLLVPADAELIIEGVIEPESQIDEGPFGEYTGYSTDRSTHNVVKVSAITHRNDMIYHNIIPGASTDHLNLSKVSRVPRIFETVKRTFSNAVAINYPISGTHFHCYVSIHDPIPGQAKQLAMLLFGLDMYLKLVVVVNDDVDVYNEQEVLWSLATRFQADRDMFAVEGVLCNLLDPSSLQGVATKLGLDATKPPDFTAIKIGLPDELVMKVRQAIEKRGKS